MAMPQGRARVLATLSLSTRRLSILPHVEVASRAAASPSFSPRGRPGQPRHPARAGPLRATPAELQFDISRPARARQEPKHVPGCFIAAAAAAGPGGCVCACVCECVCARPGGREAGGGGGRRSAGAGSWSPGEAKKVNSSCCARAWENPAPCALAGAHWRALRVGCVCVCVCVSVSGPPSSGPRRARNPRGRREPSPGAYHPPTTPTNSAGPRSALPGGERTPWGGEWGIIPTPHSTPDFGLEVLTLPKASLATARGRGGGLLVCSQPRPSLPPRGLRRPPRSRDA